MGTGAITEWTSGQVWSPERRRAGKLAKTKSEGGKSLVRMESKENEVPLELQSKLREAKAPKPDVSKGGGGGAKL